MIGKWKVSNKVSRPEPLHTLIEAITFDYIEVIALSQDIPWGEIHEYRVLRYDDRDQ